MNDSTVFACLEKHPFPPFLRQRDSSTVSMGFDDLLNNEMMKPKPFLQHPQYSLCAGKGYEFQFCLLCPWPSPSSSSVCTFLEGMGSSSEASRSEGHLSSTDRNVGWLVQRTLSGVVGLCPWMSCRCQLCRVGSSYIWE